MKFTVFVCMMACSCAKLPSHSIQLSNALQQEAGRMHQLNITLVEYVFREKKHMVNEFIANDYTPAVVQSVMQRLPPDADVKREMPDIVAAINPKIDDRRDSLLAVLQHQKNSIIAQLSTDYDLFERSFLVMHNVLGSKSNWKEAQIAINDLRRLSNYKIDIASINTALDHFITSDGSVNENEVVLTKNIQSLLDRAETAQRPLTKFR